MDSFNSFSSLNLGKYGLHLKEAIVGVLKKADMLNSSSHVGEKINKLMKDPPLSARVVFTS